jgi:hypothetical protein
VKLRKTKHIKEKGKKTEKKKKKKKNMYYIGHTLG